MFEEQTAKVIEKRMLNNVSDLYDKREGSIIYDATAPAAVELAEAYLMANAILQETFATTASRKYLIMRAAEFNIKPKEATFAVVKGQFNQAVDIGTRFNSNGVSFTVTSLLDDTAHTYKLTCETAGTAGNYSSGNITPVSTVPGLTSAMITGVIVPGQDEEDTEAFRERYFEALKSNAYGGNGADYREKVTALSGVGGVKVYRCWNGGGTVKCVVLNSEYNIPAADFVADLQKQIDPPNEPGMGYGIAPIGHTVTVAAATGTSIAVTAKVTTATGTALADIKEAITGTIGSYLLSLRQAWCQQTEKGMVSVRPSAIMVKALAVAGVADITDIKVNGQTTKLDLATDAVPLLGTVTLTEGA